MINYFLVNLTCFGKIAFGAFYSDQRGVQGSFPVDVGLTLHDFYIKNFLYRLLETLHVRAYTKMCAHALSMCTHTNMNAQTKGSHRIFFCQNILQAKKII